MRYVVGLTPDERVPVVGIKERRPESIYTLFYFFKLRKEKSQ